MGATMKFKSVIAMCALLAAGCVQQAGTPTPVAGMETGTRSANPADGFSSVAGEWMVSRLESGPGDAGSPITMSLRSTGEFAGSAGCNRYFGKFVWEEGKLASGPVGSTMMACEESVMAMESIYLGLLPRVARVSRTDEWLQLLDDQGLVLAEMRPADSPENP